MGLRDRLSANYYIPLVAGVDSAARAGILAPPEVYAPGLIDGGTGAPGGIGTGDGGNETPDDATISKPAITAPSSGATAVAVDATATSDAFASSNGQTHTKSRWVIEYRSADTSNVANGAVVYDSGPVTASLESLSLALADLGKDTQYAIKVRYKGSGGGWSPWSDYTLFSTVSCITYTYQINAGGTPESVATAAYADALSDFETKYGGSRNCSPVYTETPGYPTVDGNGTQTATKLRYTGTTYVAGTTGLNTPPWECPTGACKKWIALAIAGDGVWRTFNSVVDAGGGLWTCKWDGDPAYWATTQSTPINSFASQTLDSTEFAVAHNGTDACAALPPEEPDPVPPPPVFVPPPPPPPPAPAPPPGTPETQDSFAVIALDMANSKAVFPAADTNTSMLLSAVLAAGGRATQGNRVQFTLVFQNTGRAAGSVNVATTTDSTSLVVTDVTAGYKAWHGNYPDPAPVPGGYATVDVPAKSFTLYTVALALTTFLHETHTITFDVGDGNPISVKVGFMEPPAGT